MLDSTNTIFAMVTGGVACVFGSVYGFHQIQKIRLDIQKLRLELAAEEAKAQAAAPPDADPQIQPAPAAKPVVGEQLVQSLEGSTKRSIFVVVALMLIAVCTLVFINSLTGKEYAEASTQLADATAQVNNARETIIDREASITELQRVVNDTENERIALQQEREELAAARQRFTNRRETAITRVQELEQLVSRSVNMIDRGGTLSPDERQQFHQLGNEMQTIINNFKETNLNFQDSVNLDGRGTVTETH